MSFSHYLQRGNDQSLRKQCWWSHKRFSSQCILSIAYKLEYHVIGKKHHRIQYRRDVRSGRIELSWCQMSGLGRISHSGKDEYPRVFQSSHKHQKQTHWHQLGMGISCFLLISLAVSQCEKHMVDMRHYGRRVIPHNISAVILEFLKKSSSFNIPEHASHVSGAGQDLSIIQKSAAWQISCMCC